MSIPEHLKEMYDMTDEGNLSLLGDLLQELEHDIEKVTESSERNEMQKEIRLIRELEVFMILQSGLKLKGCNAAVELARKGNIQEAALILNESDKL